MRTDVRTRLDAQFDDFTIVDQIHDVPPHEVFAVTVDGERALYKGSVGPTGKAGLEGRVMRLLATETTVPVPPIELIGEDWYLAEWDDRAPKPDDPGTADVSWASAAGRGLATLHEESAALVDQYGHLKPDGKGVTVEGHDSWHTAAIDYVRERRPVLAEYGHEDVADAVLDLFGGQPEAFERADEPVICHGWATPEHVAVDDDTASCFVDWEHVLAAPGEWDYLRTIGPAFGPDYDGDAAIAFQEGYESVRPFNDGFEHRRHYYLLLNGVYYFESLYVQDQHTDEETERRASRLREQVHTLIDEVA